jgi:succinate dehydrogenase/fumarate reductase flavoprotein subunit
MSTNHTVACDVLVIGAGAAGMTAAVTARHHGLDVIVTEKAQALGGASALSGGNLWIPANPQARRLGIDDSSDAARRYLAHEMGNRFDPERVDAFLENAPRMLEFFEKNTAVRFFCRYNYPDYHPEAEGGMMAGGRTICAEPFDARALGAYLAVLRRPLRTETLMGMMTTPLELPHYYNALRSPRSFFYVGARLLSHAWDMLRHGRAMRLTNGNALAARLVKSLLDLGIPLWLSSPARELVVTQGAVTGALVETENGLARVEARRGVVLACGGFPHDPLRRQELLPRLAAAMGYLPLGPAENTGDGLRLAETAGGQLDQSAGNAAFWTGVSRVPIAGGAIQGHYFDRQRPGVIAVTRSGRRFVNEAVSYHEFGEALIRACEPGAEAAGFLVCDHRAIRRYGLGFARPLPLPLFPHLRSGYLLRGQTLAELARRAGIDAAGLAATVETFNTHARRGEDPEFGKGSSAFNRYFGDVRRQPNVCLGPVEHPPFYALKISVGLMGTLAGLKTDRYARVLDQGGRAVPGLYAVGNDMANVFGGTCPGGGITLAPGMTFAFIAGRHLAGVDHEESSAAERNAAQVGATAA